MTQNQYSAFIEKLTDPQSRGFGYPEFAGLDIVYGILDYDVTEDSHILPESGDIVVYNRREQGGIFGICHEALEIWDVELNATSEYAHIFSAIPSKPAELPTDSLWAGYVDLASLFADDEELEVNFGFQSYSELLDDFKDDAPYLSGDESLSLYWLLVFGFLDDRIRFDRVREVAPKKSTLIEECLGFFSVFSAGYDIDLSRPYHSEEEKAFLKTAFRKRHTYLLDFYRPPHTH